MSAKDRCGDTAEYVEGCGMTQSIHDPVVKHDQQHGEYKNSRVEKMRAKVSSAPAQTQKKHFTAH